MPNLFSGTGISSVLRPLCHQDSTSVPDMDELASPCSRHVPCDHGVMGAVRPRKDSPFRPRALKRAARAESLASRAFCAVLRWASPLETTNTGTSWNEGSLITAITNPRNHAASRPKGGRALGRRQALSQAGTRDH